MKQYHDYLRTILREGVQVPNRTGIDTIFTPGQMMKFDLQDGFPIVTTKKVPFNQVKGELLGFLRGCTNVKDFQALGCTVWDANAESSYWLANPNNKGDGDLGRIYGKNWREWRTYKPHPGANPQEPLVYLEGPPVDQIVNCIKTILTDPNNRRIIFHAWNPAELDQMALPPCHLLYQFNVDTVSNKLHLCMYQRSCDSFLGVPFNICSCALLLSIVARLTNYDVGTFTHFLADAHIYVNHLDQVNELLTREPFPLPALHLSNKILPLKQDATTKHISDAIERIEPTDISLAFYQSHAAIKAEMAV